MSEQSQSVQEAIRELVMANRILGNEGVVDALGHVSVRHPEDAGRYLLSCSRSPALVTEDDILEFDLDSNPIDQRGRALYAERPIHGCIYRSRPDVHAVCHSHARPLIPFSVTGVPIKPTWVMGAVIGGEVPLWDIREDFPHEDGMLVVNNSIGSSLARRVGPGRTCLLAGHGAVTVAETIRRVVQVAISLVTNAELLLQSRLLALSQDARDLRFLGSGEIRAMAELASSPRALERMWEYWATRAGYSPGIEMVASGFDRVIEQYHQATGAMLRGNPEGYYQIYSHGDDVTLANPFGPPVCGWDQVAPTLERAGGNYRDGEILAVETIAKEVTSELAYLVEMERCQAKVGGQKDMTPVVVRATTVLRLEDGTWKVVHRHADPITAPRPPESVIQR